MAKGRGSKSSKLAAAREATTTAPSETTTAPVNKGKAKQVSDELRQAVKDLGGDDDDLDLIAGIDGDSDEEEAMPVTKGKKKDEATVDAGLKKALGDFMKGLDFKSVAPDGHATAVEDDSDDVEDVSDESSDDDGPDEEDEDDDEEEEEDEEEEGESEEEEQEASESDEQPAPVSAKRAPAVEQAVVKKTEKQTSKVSDVSSTSAKDVPATPVWTSLAPQLAATERPLEPMAQFQLQGLRSKANALLENLTPLNRSGSSSDAAFISQILQSGTHQDKLSALVLIVRESPIHAVKELNRLRSMMGFKEDGTVGGGGNKDQRVAVIRALADWWTTGGGKDSGKLRYFADQPLLSHPDITDRHLLVFAFEDYLKKWFFNLLQVLEVLSHDTLPYVRVQSLHVIFQLLSGNAEQEQNLLRLGVNKLGDNDKSVASKTSHQILTLLQVHPAMKTVIARDISALVLKPVAPAASGPSSGTHVRFDEAPAKKADKDTEKAETMTHGRYYGLITLNQITLSPKDQDVAGRLVELYFEVFREVLGESMKLKEETAPGGEDDEELAEAQIEKVAGKVNKWQGRRKGSKPKGGRKTAAQGEQLVETSEARLIAAVLSGINRALPYAKLDEELFTKYMDTLFKITHAGTFNTSIQALSLIQQICQSRGTNSDRFYRTLYDSLLDERLITSSKQAMYLNMLFKALKADSSLPRVMAFVKRLLQMLGLHQPPFICGALYLLGELFSATPGLKRMLIEPEDDGDEHFVDAPEDGAPAASSSKAPAAATERTYDGKKREPQYAHADSSCLWELMPFVNHFHPSVSLQANQLLLSQPLTGSADISLNTLVSFLDRFVYRNPKKTLQPKGASIMQPAAANDASGMVFNKKGARSGESSYVNSEAFWRKKIADVPVDQLFFHKFFSTKLAQKDAAKKKTKKGGDDDDEMLESDSDADMSGDELPASVADEEESDAEDDDEDDGNEAEDNDDDESEPGSDPEEDEIWKAMKASMPGAADDMGLSDIDDSDDDLEMSEEDEDEEEDEEVSDGEGDEGDEDEDEEESEVEPEPEPVKSKGKGKKRAPSPEEEEEEDDYEDAMDLASDSDDDDLIPLEKMPDIRLDGNASPEEEDQDELEQGKRKRREDRKERRKKRKQMPVFASADDYRKMIDDAPSEED